VEHRPCHQFRIVSIHLRNLLPSVDGGDSQLAAVNLELATASGFAGSTA
jgi:hypothetical protein